MPPRKKSSPKTVREPAQVYLAVEDSELLARLAAETHLSKAEILRRGIRSFAREQSEEVSPMLQFIAELAPGNLPTGFAENHDAILAEEYAGKQRKRR